jgi:hypothetical protein
VVALFWGLGEAFWAEPRLRLRRVVLEARDMSFEAARARNVDAYVIAIAGATGVNARIRYGGLIVLCGVDCAEDTFSRE